MIGDDVCEVEVVCLCVVFEEEVLSALRAFYVERGYLNVSRAYVVLSDVLVVIVGMKFGN